MSKTNILNKVENMDKNKIYELANLLKILFIGFDNKSDNKVLKQQLKYILKYLQEPNKTNEVIEDLINDFDIFNEEYENWDWFKFRALDIINNPNAMLQVVAQVVNSILINILKEQLTMAEEIAQLPEPVKRSILDETINKEI